MAHVCEQLKLWQSKRYCSRKSGSNGLAVEMRGCAKKDTPTAVSWLCLRQVFMQGATFSTHLRHAIPKGVVNARAVYGLVHQARSHLGTQVGTTMYREIRARCQANLSERDTRCFEWRLHLDLVIEMDVYNRKKKTLLSLKTFGVCASIYHVKGGNG